MNRKQRRTIKRIVEKKLGRKVAPKKLPSSPFQLTSTQIKELSETIVIEDTYTTKKGYSINYTVTEVDVLNREISFKEDVEMEFFDSNEIYNLLNNIYGLHPNNFLKNVLFDIENESGYGDIRISNGLMIEFNSLFNIE